jgi:hypothetical protein
LIAIKAAILVMSTALKTKVFMKKNILSGCEKISKEIVVIKRVLLLE